MKLKLTNFRCYTEAEFDFGNDGLLLLSGDSGKGKTSIFLAINFVLYGTGTKLVMHDKSSCRVEMEFENFHIVRTKRPNRLVLNSIHEDASAQSIIDKKFGKTFDVTGYIAQNAFNSFVMMSPIDKLEFLEKFAFVDIDLTNLKHKCRELIKQRNEQLIVCTSELGMALQMLETLEEPTEVVYPLKPTNNQERAMKNEIIRHKNASISISRRENSLKKLNIEREHLKILEEKINSWEDILKNIILKIDAISEEKETIKYEGDDNLKNYEEQLLFVVSLLELQHLEKRYNEDELRLSEMKETEVEEMNKKLEKIDNSLWKEYTPDEVKTTIEEYKQLLKDITASESLHKSLCNYEVDVDKLQKYKRDLKYNKKELEKKRDLLVKLNLQKEQYTCPSCNEIVRIQDDVLVTSSVIDIDNETDTDLLEDEISSLYKLVNRLEYIIPQEQNRLDRYNEIKLKIDGISNQYEEELPTSLEIETDLEYIKEYKKTQQDLEKQKKEVERCISGGKYSSTIGVFEDTLKKQLKKIKHLQKKKRSMNTEITDEQELRLKIQVQKRSKDRLDDLEKREKILIHEKLTYQNKISEVKTSHINTYKKIRKSTDIQLLINKRKKDIVSLEEDYKRHSKNIEKIDKYKQYLQERVKYHEWVEKVKTLKNNEKVARSKYAAVTLLKEKIIEAESVAMINIINSINYHVQQYLDLFFITDPMSARLLPYKETKKNKKPQINIQIDHKGMDTTISTLSGGELSRVILAYSLGLAEIFNTPLILLDECTASLDQNSTTQVINGLRENFSNKLIIVIAHQCVSGIFDRTIVL